MEYEAQASTIRGQLGRDITPIESAIQRLRLTIGALHTVSEQVEGHADRLFGPVPTATGAGSPVAREVRSGVMGGLEDALDALAEAQARISDACARNSTLA